MTTAETPGDERDLAGFGYAQSLGRSLGGFSSFAAGFAFISILTGLFQMLGLGLAFAGPGVFWTWPVVALGQMSLALGFAELAARYPLCGSVYQWARRVGSPSVGWMAGWISMAGSVVSLAAVSMALQAVLPALWSGFQVVGTAGDPASEAKNAVLLGCVLIGLTTFLNARGVRLLATINNVGVMVELLGAVALVALLFAHARRGPMEALSAASTRGGGPIGPGAYLAAALTASYVLYGFETAGSLAEETVSPRKKSPRAIVLALGSAAVLGGLLILSALMAADDPADPDLAGGGLTLIVRTALGPGLGSAFLVVVAVAIVSCALTVHAGAVRLVFALARDGLLPGSGRLGRVGGSGSPVAPAIVVGGLAALGLLMNFQDPKVVVLIATVSVVWIDLAYFLVSASLLACRLSRGWPESPSFFRLGRFGTAVNVVAVGWAVAIVINTGWPRAEVYGPAWHQRFAAPLATAALVVLGLLIARDRRRRIGRPPREPRR